MQLLRSCDLANPCDNSANFLSIAKVSSQFLVEREQWAVGNIFDPEDAADAMAASWGFPRPVLNKAPERFE
jgi:hypothetical protein